jgi:hypothetical protein
MRKKPDPNRHLPPALAAAQARAPRHLRRAAGKKTKNNYLAENTLSRCNAKQTSKCRPGAPPGNLNAVGMPVDTPERVALYRRYAACMRNGKRLIAILRAETRRRKLELQTQ